MSTNTPTGSTAVLIIEDGDNKFAMFQQLINLGCYNNDGRAILPFFRVKARLEGLQDNRFTQDDHLWISGIRAANEGGEVGESWIINGFYPNAVPNSTTHTRRGGKFEGSYNTRTRKGRIVVTFS